MLPSGEVVQTIEQSREWVRVRTQAGTETWLRAEAIPGLSSGPSGQLVSGGRMVLGQNVTLGSQPGAGSTQLESVMAGDTLLVLERSGDWIKVRSPSGSRGWVHEDALVGLGPVIERRQLMNESPAGILAR